MSKESKRVIYDTFDPFASIDFLRHGLLKKFKALWATLRYHSMQKKLLSQEEGLQKLKQYCAYQERSHKEVSQKLWDLGVVRAAHDAIIAALIDEDYLNEERFAVQYAGGKFRIKQWGKKKILHALKEKGVSAYCINKALKALPEADYSKTLNNLAQKKYGALKSDQYLVRKKKTTDYLLQKGFEPELVTAAINRLSEKEH